MKNLLIANRKRINDELGFDKRKYFSPATLSDSRVTPPLIDQYARGKCIDVGCGDAPLREHISAMTDCYHTLDIESRDDQPLTYVSSACDMKDVKDASYDFAVSFHVLEHVNNPFQAMAEIGRILKPGGVLILSVPHLCRLHEEPHDYFRFTKYGLQHLAECSELEVLSITPTGGLFSFLGHQLSTLLLVPFWHIPVLKHLLFVINKYCISHFFSFLDRKMDKNRIFALGYTCALRKKVT